MSFKTQTAIVIFALIGILIFIPFLLKINSAVSFNPIYNAEDINLEASENSNFDLNITNVLTSVSISGVVKGEGKASVYLNTADGQRLLVYTGSAVQKPAGITGFFAASKADQDYFQNACKDTCYFTDGIGPYSLSVELEPNTSIIIARIVYK